LSANNPEKEKHMNITELIGYRIKGEPHFRQSGGDMRITAAHRLPNSGFEHVIALYLFGVIGAVCTLVAQYSPEMASDPETNFLLENAAVIIMALSNAFDALATVAQADAQPLPLEELRGWMFASYWIVGVFLFRITGLHDLLMWFGNRERVSIVVGDDELRVRHGTFRFARRIALDHIEDILILANHRTGHDVMLQHTGGLMRLASVHGDLTRPTLIKRSVERALAARSQPEKRRIAAVPERAPA
jgi:hypothetical protein